MYERSTKLGMFRNAPSIRIVVKQNMSLKKSRVEGEFTEKQLTEDFGVSQYLRENKLTNNNIDNYIRFYDEILLKKRRKADKLQQLRDTHNRCNEDFQSKDLTASTIRAGELEQINTRAAHELSVREQLEKTCSQHKKSLVLLKGDIGHIISRNQSEQLLQSKIHKVKIVADDQYSKVYLEYLKDRQEKRELEEMQKSFLTKLCSVKRFEGGVLGRTRDQFFDLMARQRTMNQKLSNIEQRSLLIKEQVELNKQKNHNNYIVAYISYLLHALTEMMMSPQAIKILRETEKLDSSLSAILARRDAILQELIRLQKERNQLGPKIDCEQLAERILLEYQSLKMKLESLSQQYSETLLKYRHITGRHLTASLHRQSGRLEDPGTLQQSTLALSLRIKGNLKIAIVCLNFFLERAIPKQQPHLMNRLISLLKEDANQQSTAFFQLLPQNFTETMRGYVDSLLFAHRARSDGILKKSPTKMVPHIPRTEGRQLLTEEFEQQEQMQDRQGEDPYILFHNLMCRAVCGQQSGSTHSNPDNHMARRLRFLQTIDKDYAHMLKQTLKMQKDHTRKNHDFQKSWKRQKYVNRDAILKQRRFQASFSHLWKANQKSFRRRKTSRNHTAVPNSALSSLASNSPLNKICTSSSFVKSPIGMSPTPPVSKTSKWAVLDVLRQQHFR